MVGQIFDDSVTNEYLKRCKDDDKFRSMMSASPLPLSFKKEWGSRLTPRPFFAERKAMEALGFDIKDLFDIIVSLPDRLFGGDLDRYCSEVGIDVRRAALVNRLLDVEPPRSGRADLYRDGADFKLLEYNVNTGIGGADMVEIYHALMASSPFAEFAMDFGLDYADAMADKANLLRDAAVTVAGDREPVIAAVEADGGISAWSEGFRSIQHSMARYGIDLLLGELGQLKRRNGRLYLDGKPVDLVLRYFNVDQIVDDESGREAYEMLCRAHERGEIVLHTALKSQLFNDKAALALLSDPGYRNSFSTAERDLIDRMLPWTRVLREGPTWVDGDRVDLVEYSVERRQSLILKPGAGYSGIGVVAGWETEEREWEELLRRSVGGPFIIQHRVDPTPEVVVDPESGRSGHVRPAWGVFFSESGYGGGVIRTAPSDGGAVINFASNPKASITGLFTYDGAVGRDRVRLTSQR